MVSAVMPGRERTMKKGVCNDTARRRREDTTIALRKSKREESIAKRRNIRVEGSAAEDLANPAEGVSLGADFVAPSKTAGAVPTVADIPRLLQEIQANDPATVTAATRGWRKLLSIEPQPPVEAVLETGVVTIFARHVGLEMSNCSPRLLQYHEHPDLQFEAAWALTNIASTERTDAVVEAGVVPTMVTLCRSGSADVREQCIWCLGNVAGDSPTARDAVLAAGALEPVLANIVAPASTNLLRNATWALSNLCRGKPQAALERLQPAIPVLCELLKHVDVDTLMDACWALSYLSDGDEERIQAVVDCNAAALLVPLLSHESHKCITPALRTLGNIVTGTDVQTKCALDAGVLDRCEALIRSTRRGIRKETCWLLSNIAAGTPQQTAAVANRPGLVRLVVQQLEHGDWDVRKEAAWVVSNILSANDPAHAAQLVDYGVVKPLTDLLTVQEPKVVVVALDALDAILKCHSFGGVLASTLVDEADGIDRIEALQEHENPVIYEKSISLLERYFGGEDENSSLAPNVDPTASMFQFGVTA